MAIKLFFFCAVLLCVNCDRVTFKNVSISTYFANLGTISSSKSLKEYLPKNFTTTVVVSGKIPVLYEDSVKDIDNVKELYFLKNGIEEIEPGAFKNLSSVTSLTISHSRFKNIKEGVLDNLALQELQVSFVPLGTVARGAFGNLSKLMFLSLNNDEIEIIEENSFDTLNNLQILDLAKNEISKLPDEILKNLPNLQMLMFPSNKLVNLEEKVFDNPSVYHLDLKDNLISTLPENLFKRLPKLVRIILSHNQLTSIPKGVFNDQPLHQIELNNNKISFVHPEAFDNMPHLANVMLSSNKLTQYDSNWFRNTPNIYRLFLSYNLIEEVPDEAFRNIYNHKKQWLKLDSNRIKKISPKTFKGFKKINNLNLSHNELYVWDESFLQDAEEVDYLNLIYNKITCPSGDFTQVFKANITYMDGNPLSEECLDRIRQWELKNSKVVCTAGESCY